tara:strand:- start:5399 stop:5968 length:570 start_codon:yes stop_codon:yes gene_type:complete
MAEPQIQNPNDYKVVTFHNKTDFAFTPEMGSMYDGRPIFGISGAPAINPGESIVLPYHVGNLLAKNLAKAVMTRKAPQDAAGVPTGVAIWNDDSLEALRVSYITEMYSEEKPAAVSETDRLMAKVEEYKAMVDKLIPKQDAGEAKTSDPKTDATPSQYADKADVIAELAKRGIKYDARQNKATLEKLIA